MKEHENPVIWGIEELQKYYRLIGPHDWWHLMAAGHWE
ncbi:hypothetical protein N624_0614 [Levilactobacillus brevis]|nr:hypothetical protein N624_0614 [Levilactobacillus brevis]KIO96900.1 hypothetical protein N627_1872 [Levilactobacillus brevis]